jgi:hypothetical protein
MLCCAKGQRTATSGPCQHYFDTNMQLHEQLEAVTDEATFLIFVRALVADWRANAEAWENSSIEDFLEASSSWAEDSEFGSTQGISTASPWKKFAVFLYCGKMYE